MPRKRRPLATPSVDASAASEAPPRPGRLFAVATPIGNLGDITLRALDTLRSVRLVAAEDTRRTGLLLKHFGISVPLLSYQAHNRAQRLPQILEALQGGDVALVTDAGTPVISDPGQELVAAAAEAGHAVIPIPGPSAPVAALAVAGLPALPFHFLGFLPRRSSARRASLAEVVRWPGALVLFEAPHRLLALLEDTLAVLGDRRLAVCCELTKLYEHVLRGTVAEALEHYRAHPPRGEFTIVIAGDDVPVRGNAVAGNETDKPAMPTAMGGASNRRQRFDALVAQLGDRRLALAALAAETGLPRKALYAELVSGTGREPFASPSGRGRAQRG